MPLLRLIKSVVEVALIYHKTLRDFNKNNWGGGGIRAALPLVSFPTESTNVSIESCMLQNIVFKMASTVKSVLCRLYTFWTFFKYIIYNFLF